MGTRERDAIESAMGDLRYEPIGARIRGVLAGTTVVDTTDAMVAWEPRRLLCEYAVPAHCVHASLGPAQVSGDLPDPPAHGPIFPGVPFGVHTAEGEALDVTVGDRVLPGAAFRPADPDLEGRVLLDFDAFDSWMHEDEVNVGHPRDPYHRIDTYPSARRVRVEHNGTVIAESTRAVALFEAMLPPRYYIPRDDVLAELIPTATSSVCGYKGEAAYWSARVGDTELTDVGWGYPEPLPNVTAIRDTVCFDDSQVQVLLDPA